MRGVRRSNWPPLMQLLAHLPEVKHRILRKLAVDDNERVRVAVIELEMLPYTLSAARYACIQVLRSQLLMVEGFFREQPDFRGVFVLSSEQQSELSFAVDSFLESARRTQNALIPYLSRAFEVSLPSSLSDLAASITKGKVSLPPSVADLLMAYWHKHGKRLKDFRDVSQHHSLVSLDARVFLADDGRRCLRLLLPSNPELKTTSKLVYGDPPLHAIPYVRDQFFKLLSICYCLTRLILDLVPGERGQVSTPLLREPIFLGVPVQGHRLFSVEETENAISSLLERVSAQYELHIRPR